MILIKLSKLILILNKYINSAFYKFNRALGRILEAKIQKPENEGKKIVVFKPQTKETFVMPHVLGFINGSFEIDYPEISLWKFEKASIFYKSDVVLTKSGNVIWPKYFKYNYNHNITIDRNTVQDSYGLCEHNGILSIKKPKHVKIIDVVFSMIGVYDNIWAHALVEYIPKISVLSNAIKDSNRKVTVVIPEYTDGQLKEIVLDILKKYDVNIYQMSSNETIEAEILYYIERPTTFTDRETSVSIGDSTIPVATANYVKKEIVEPLQIDVKLNPSYKRIFLARRGGLGKGLINGSDVENYFEKLGFVFVEPHKLSLKEKVEMFMSAEYIAGPGGSAFTNLIFCRPGTKVIKFSNFQRQFENYISLSIQHFGIDVIYLTGIDDKSASNLTHCSYYLPLDKVKQACEYHGII